LLNNLIDVGIPARKTTTNIMALQGIRRRIFKRVKPSCSIREKVPTKSKMLAVRIIAPMIPTIGIIKLSMIQLRILTKRLLFYLIFKLYQNNKKNQAQQWT
ncbi:MAG: hypothetical protein ABIF80_01885, partial [Patescibacteria group bacterium]